ncbi:MAG: energy transducer TonB, partial [Thermodesulfobacteriota bacterium]
SGGAASGPAGSSDALAKDIAALRRSVSGGGGGQGGVGPGGGGGGGGGGGATLQVYAQIVNRIIKQNWRFPQMAANDNLLAVVELQIGKDGRILQYQLVQSSGRPNFDASALKAVAETESLPPPPLPSLSVLQLNFNSRELGQ